MVSAANESEDDPPSPEALTLLEARQQAREDQNWAESDRLRDEIASLGWQIQDTPEGAKLVKE